MANGQDFISRGNLQIQVINIRNNFPIQNAKVSISSKGEPERVLEQLTTDSSGQTENISLPAPPEEYSLEPGIYQPYSEYDVLVEAEGFKPLISPAPRFLQEHRPSSLQHLQVMKAAHLLKTQ